MSQKIGTFDWKFEFMMGLKSEGYRSATSIFISIFILFNKYKYRYKYYLNVKIYIYIFLKKYKNNLDTRSMDIITNII